MYRSRQKRRNPRIFFIVIGLIGLAAIFFFLLPSLLFTHSRLSGFDPGQRNCDEAEGFVGQVQCELTVWYYGMFELEDYDVRQVNDVLVGAAAKTNVFAQDMEQDIDVLLSGSDKRKVEYVWDDVIQSYRPQ